MSAVYYFVKIVVDRRCYLCYNKHIANKLELKMASLKKCIENKCKDCTYDSCAPGSWRYQVELCRVLSCPLWEVRPITMETMLARRKDKNAPGVVDLDALVDDMDDEEDEAPEAVAS